MASTDQGNTFIKEFKDFIDFLKNLWGILAGISVLFPLSNALAHLIPLETIDKGGILIWLSPAMFTTLATLSCLFLILWTFSQRQNFQSPKISRYIQRQSLISFAVGLAILITYMVIYFALAAYYGEYGWSSGDIRHLIGEVPLLILYGAFFVLVTRAFLLLGMGEYFKSEK
jgi:hypothetical protein